MRELWPYFVGVLYTSYGRVSAIASIYGTAVCILLQPVHRLCMHFLGTHRCSASIIARHFNLKLLNKLYLHHCMLTYHFDSDFSACCPFASSSLYSVYIRAEWTGRNRSERCGDRWAAIFNKIHETRETLYICCTEHKQRGNANLLGDVWMCIG